MNAEDYMNYKNHRFTIQFIKQQFPHNYRCSRCGDGILAFKDGEFHCEETIKSLSEHDHEEWEPEWIRSFFSGTLKCKNCSEHYFVSGTGRVEYEWDDDGTIMAYDVYYPKFFIPVIHIFKLPVNTPEKIAEIIETSFSLAWTDYSSAGNKLRVALELIVSDLVPNSDETLGNKIKNISDDMSEIRDMIKAIKWLGNQGSHEAVLQEYDLAFAFKITKRVLDTLYPNKDDSEQLMVQVHLVNEAKGSIAKSTT